LTLSNVPIKESAVFTTEVEVAFQVPPRLLMILSQANVVGMVSKVNMDVVLIAKLI
jgi:hypothetical protein